MDDDPLFLLARLQAVEQGLHEISVVEVRPSVERELIDILQVRERAESFAVRLKEIAKKKLCIHHFFNFLRHLVKDCDVRVIAKSLELVTFPPVSEVGLNLIFESLIDRLVIVELLDYAKELGERVTVV